MPARRLRYGLQWGVDHPRGSRPSPLVTPLFAQWTPEETCLIVDCGALVNRILEVDAAGRVVWSQPAEPRVAFAHVLDDRHVGFVQGSGYYVVERAQDAQPELRAELPSAARVECAAARGDVLALVSVQGVVSFLSTSGRELGTLDARTGGIVEPKDVELLAERRLLLVDVTHVYAAELDAAGRCIATFRAPPGRVLNPVSACRLLDGRTLVADWRSHQLVEYDPGGAFTRYWEPSGEDRMFMPSHVRQIDDARILVTEAGARRVSVRTLDGTIAWSYGPDRMPARTFSFPRCVQRLDGDGLLVCDAFADRVVEVDERGAERRSFGGADLGLVFPRSAERGAEGETLVADGYNGRVLLLGADGSLSRELRRIRVGREWVALRDPHHAAFVDDLVLLVDSGAERVYLVDDDDRAVTTWGGEEILSDPHQAVLRGRSVAVADTGNDRVVVLGADGAVEREVRATIEADGRRRALAAPRCVDVLPGGELVIADSNACRVVVVDALDRVLMLAGPDLALPPGSAAAPELRVPKWVSVDASGRLLVCDYYNSRVVELRGIETIDDVSAACRRPPRRRRRLRRSRRQARGRTPPGG